MRRSILLLSIAVLVTVARPSMQTPARGGQAADPTRLGSDANGNPLRKAIRTGHVSNYDESKVEPYALPDPLVNGAGARVTDASMWSFRRDELLETYRTQIYGRVPASAPRVSWAVADTDPRGRDGTAIVQHVVGTVGNRPNAPRIRVTVYTPAAAASRGVPLILLVNFGGGAAARGGPARANGEPPNAADILARGWGYATVGYQDIQPDRADAWTEGVIGASLAPGQRQPRPGEWGTIGAWAWGVSRIVDYLETDPKVDGTHIALHGFSRLGKTVLWAAAQDRRIKAVFSACAGEMGSALARRDWGETVDDMAQNFPWQFASTFQQWVGRWNDMPVDAHMLIALIAPRPVFITGGTTDQWSDPKGEFLAEVAAGPVYRLLGKRDLGTADYPAPDSPIVTGDLAFNLHTGPHRVTPEEWATFVTWLGRYF